MREDTKRKVKGRKRKRYKPKDVQKSNQRKTYNTEYSSSAV